MVTKISPKVSFFLLNLCDLRLNEGFLGITTKSWSTIEKVINCDSLKLGISVLQRH